MNGAIAYFNQAGISTDANNGISGSLSMLHDSGVSLTFATGTKDLKAQNRKDQQFMYGKIGYAVGLNALGPTRFSVDYGKYDDIAQDNDTMTSFGVQAVQDIDDVGASLYAGYRHYALDRTGSSFDDIYAVMTGARISF